MDKDFDRWNIKKKRLDVAQHQPPLVSEGDLMSLPCGRSRENPECNSIIARAQIVSSGALGDKINGSIDDVRIPACRQAGITGR